MGRDRAYGGPGNDLLAGGEGDYYDRLDGEDGDDQVADSGTSNDNLHGGNGDDLLDAGAGGGDRISVAQETTIIPEGAGSAVGHRCDQAVHQSDGWV